jgi:DNA-directed RNA polymerase subunit M/transcription elongation factor TFIIS
MKQLVCTLCEKSDIIKKDGVFVCQSCGVKYSLEEAKKMMGVTSPPKDTSPEVTPTTTTVSTVIAKNFRCNGCGTSLKIPQNARGIVTCPACKNECVMDNLIKNAEIAAKENINSGIPLTATPEEIHNQILRTLSNASKMIPLDLFDKIEVTREERHCVPAFLFECSAKAAFNYEVKTESFTLTERRFVVEWKPMNSNASISTPIVSPGEKNLQKEILTLCEKFDHKLLLDVECLVFPSDVITHSYNIPQTTSFNEHVQPMIDNLLRQNALKQLEKKKHRNFSMCGSFIQKEAMRIYLGVYRIVFEYNDQEYALWVSGDGQAGYCDTHPIDDERNKAYTKIESEKKALEKTTEPYPKGCFTSLIVAAIVLLLMIVEYPIWATIGLIIVILLIIVGRSQSKDLKKISQANEQLEVFKKEQRKVARQFISKGRPLKGIYETISPLVFVKKRPEC